jgi:hypothetical protein
MAKAMSEPRDALSDEAEADDAAVRAMTACLEPLRAAAEATRAAWGEGTAESLLALGLRRAFADLITSYAHPSSPEMAAARAALGDPQEEA